MSETWYADDLIRNLHEGDRLLYAFDCALTVEEYWMKLKPYAPVVPLKEEIYSYLTGESSRSKVSAILNECRQSWDNWLRNNLSGALGFRNKVYASAHSLMKVAVAISGVDVFHSQVWVVRWAVCDYREEDYVEDDYGDVYALHCHAWNNGNKFEDRYRTPDAMGIMWDMVKRNEFDSMEVLADALLDAGCPEDHLGVVRDDRWNMNRRISNWAIMGLLRNIRSR